jgi:hypothetical protein
MENTRIGCRSSPLEMHLTDYAKVSIAVFRNLIQNMRVGGICSLMDESVSIEQAHVEDRKWQLFKLAGIDHLADAVELGIDISLICGNITRGLRMLSCLLVLKLDDQLDQRPIDRQVFRQVW